MENITEALKMAAAILLFVGALSLTIATFTKVRQTSAAVMENSDKNASFYDNIEYSSEKIVSEKSAAGIYSFIDKEKYNVYKVVINRDSWEVEYEDKTISIDKNDFSFIAKGDKINFDLAYITIHGTPGEDGVLQGYFDMLNIPYSNSGVLSSALTFNKYTLEELPLPQTEVDNFVHLCDYLSSRKFIDVKFDDDNNIIE